MPNYQFLVSWEPDHAHVNRKRKIEAKSEIAEVTAKKDIIRSLILVSFILILEIVVYLARIRFMP